ncbi:MAG: hypothetical protein N4A74_05730 [Carboxylicivirga sp.]|jgi:hypothetical protein|nr:hypothetical protein [Carboxylicivirga sp.]
MLKIIKGKKSNKRLIPDELLLVLAHKIVHQYVLKGSIPKKEEDDIKMAIVEKFLEKHDQLKQAFNGNAKRSTYCVAILHKMCCEQIRKSIKQWKQQPSEQIESGQTNKEHSMNQLVINDEIQLLDNIINLFNGERFKVRLFMAYAYQLIIAEQDIQKYDKHYKKHQLNQLFKQTELKSKGEIFSNLAIAVQKAENKNVKADAVRMWFNKVIDKIIVRLNGPFNRADYDKESTQILFEFYYNKFSNNKRPLKKEAK